MNLGDSYTLGKAEVIKYLTTALNQKIKVLDVGAGCGTYGCQLFSKGYQLDAVEIWPEAVKQLKMLHVYKNVYEADIRTFQYDKVYDLIIFGDVLEHLTVEDAQAVLKEAEKHTKAIMIAVPYLYKQGAIYGNEAERHLQPDLTFEIFNKRYCGYELIWGNNEYGYFYKEM